MTDLIFALDKTVRRRGCPRAGRAGAAVYRGRVGTAESSEGKVKQQDKQPRLRDGAALGPFFFPLAAPRDGIRGRRSGGGNFCGAASLGDGDES